MSSRRSPPRRAGSRAACAIGGQDHFYLEGQIALAIPGEDDDVTVYSSTQHPSEVQLMVAQVLGVPQPCGDGRDAPHGRRLRRQGDAGQPVRRGRGARGQEARTAPVKIRPDRDDDMTDHRQAPRFRRRLRCRLRRRRPHPRRSMPSTRRAAAFRPTCPARSPTGRCSTPTTPIAIRRCG